MSSTRSVLVNGVLVEFFDDTQPAPMSPMRVSLRVIAETPHFVNESDRVEVCRRLREAGVKFLPLYRREAEAAGVEWQEVPESSAVSAEGLRTDGGAA